MTDDPMLDRLLREARSHADFQERPVGEELLRAAHDLMKWGPTTANSQPARIFYLRSRESREKLRPANKPGVAEVNAFRNSSLQGAYLIIALRAVGLDCGAMSGFAFEERCKVL